MRPAARGAGMCTPIPDSRRREDRAGRGGAHPAILPAAGPVCCERAAVAISLAASQSYPDGRLRFPMTKVGRYDRTVSTIKAVQLIVTDSLAGVESFSLVTGILHNIIRNHFLF
jgi:hypothetical protein